MRFDYDQVAHRYDRHRSGGGPYMPGLTALADACQAARALEIGPGTGNNTQAFLEAHPCVLTGVDVSHAMLTQAAAKGVAAGLVQGDARALPVASSSVDIVFAVYVLHHIGDLPALCRECARVLRGGPAAFVTASTEYIENHPMNRYFPSFRKVDRARFQTPAEIQAALADAGFTQLDAQRCHAAPVPLDRAFAERVANKFVSTYELLPPGEFEQGMARFRADLDAAGGRIEGALVWESMLVWGVLP